MTEIMALYRCLRGEGCKHYEAIEKVALKIGVDPQTASRVVQRAERDFARFGS